MISESFVQTIRKLRPVFVYCIYHFQCFQNVFQQALALPKVGVETDMPSILMVWKMRPRAEALSFMRRKDPGQGWSCGSQILGAKLKFCLERGGRELPKNSQKCVFVYMARLPV